MSVRSATAEDIPAVLPLVRAYCEFYETTPEQAPDAGLEEMCRALIATPEDEGMLLVAEDESGEVVGFAAVGWKWSSLRASRVAILEDDRLELAGLEVGVEGGALELGVPADGDVAIVARLHRELLPPGPDRLECQDRGHRPASRRPPCSSEPGRSSSPARRWG